MQTTSVHPSQAATPSAVARSTAAPVSAYQGYQIIRRNGAVVSFEPNKIAVALMKAFLARRSTS
jgi:ribonucleoside-diphosphate reductase alpha chain